MTGAGEPAFGQHRVPDDADRGLPEQPGARTPTNTNPSHGRSAFAILGSRGSGVSFSEGDGLRKHVAAFVSSFEAAVSPQDTVWPNDYCTTQADLGDVP